MIKPDSAAIDFMNYRFINECTILASTNPAWNIMEPNQAAGLNCNKARIDFYIFLSQNDARNQSLSMSKSFDIPWQHHANHATVRFQRWAALGLQIPKTSASTSEMDHLTGFEDPLSFGKRPRMVSLCENWRVCFVLSTNGCSMEWVPHHPGIQANPQGGDAPAVISWFISPMKL